MVKKSKPEQKAKKANSSATTRSTAGPGFVFEDQIAAFLLLKMLAGEPIPSLGDDALGSTLRMQVSALGWEIDDILAVSASVGAQLALSCKSSQQVTGNGLPDEFVLDAWRQWKAQRPPNPFDQTNDKLMLVTRGRHQTFEPLWTDIKGWCAEPGNPLAIARAKQTAAHAKILESAKSAIQTIDGTITDEEVLALLARLEVLPTDFDLTNSQNRADSINRCRRLLLSGDQTEAVELWNALVSEAEAARISHGTIELGQLWPKLAKRFDLKPHINYDRSWRAIDAITADYKSGVQTTLPTGHTLGRTFDCDALDICLAEDDVVVVYGDSGSGKSSLVKSVLDQRHADWKQVWLSTDDLRAVLSEVSRPSVGLSHPLDAILRFVTSAGNVLVLDAAERFSDELASRARVLVAALIEHNKQSATKWKVIVIGQIDGWSQGKLQRIGNSTLPKHHELKSLTGDEVREGLRSAPQLRWAVAHDEIVSALTNPRTLAWVLQAATQFEHENVSSLISHIAIADHLWRYWTSDKITLQRTLMVLAEREANFEHSFEVSKLEPGDAQAIENMPAQLPIRRNRYNRIEFEHDLAADWIRFQRLKEIASETERWASLASNPLWLGALRMLGGFLLREPATDGRTAWDEAFEVVTGNAENASAAGVLLDALCLDPHSERFLEERADFLLRDHGKLLTRLLRRFLHVATVPGGPSKLLSDVLYSEASFGLYLEAQFRTPIPGRWVAVARFLDKHRARIAALCSSTVASVCERWLSAYPAELSGTPFPLRKEFAELALATARAVQLEMLKRTIFDKDSAKQIYSAALAAAPDLPNEVSQWALEMARRRSLDPGVAAALADHRKQQAAEHEQKLKTDEQYRLRHKRKMATAMPGIPSGRKLPPWPLGPQGRIDHYFRDCCAHGASLIRLMSVCPDVAAELVLAIVIEAEPEEEYSSSPRLSEKVGLAYDGQSYPTGFWKSPFFSFLQINRDVALEGLIKLVNFCTERWKSERLRYSGGHCPSVTLTMTDGSTRQYLGSSRVYDWCLANTNSSGQINSGLAALERWLTQLVESGDDVSPIFERLLRETHSISVLAVLVNIGKLKPELFLGVLRPLAADGDIHLLDKNLVACLSSYFGGMQLAPLGEIIFGMARDWHFAPQHRAFLTNVVIELILSNSDFSGFVKGAASAWALPKDEKAALEKRILAARLDNDNYAGTADASNGEKKPEFTCPEALLKDIKAYQQSKATPLGIINLPDTCLGILRSNSQMDPKDAATLASYLPVIETETSLDENLKARARAAAASTLVVKAGAWLKDNHETAEIIDRIISDGLASIGDTADALRGARHDWRDDFTFLTYAVFQRWLQDPSPETDAAVIKILTSGNRGAEAHLFTLAHRNRQKLGQRWTRLIDLGILWAGLSILRPGFEKEAAAWDSWLRRFRACRLSGGPPSLKRPEPVEIAQRVERLERARWRREFGKSGRHSRIPPEERRSHGLDWSFLETSFAWLTSTDVQDIWDERQLLLSLWSYEVWLRHRTNEDRKDDQGPTQLGYNLLAQLARYALFEPRESAQQIWEPVLTLGAPAQYAVGHFLQFWFQQAPAADAAEFAVRWRRMIEYALASPAWGSGDPWYYGQRLLTQVLGYRARDDLDRNEAFQAIVLNFKPLYAAWASEHLNRDDDNVTALCSFLSSSTGKPLRFDGLNWLQAALSGDHSVYIGGNSNAFDSMVHLFDVILSEDISTLSFDTQARSTFLSLVDILVAKQVPAALTLQERARRLLRPDRS
ncbi:ABC-type cobalamin/Fe3+-siderophores transport system ATPase subunit [Bradyrhizobium sp. LA6.10]|uniref:ATP-binding protein n=1 Tax=Bradyrhizobium sp. LA6.10 TaxID=3156318 RepID=UPI00339330DA